MTPRETLERMARTYWIADAPDGDDVDGELWDNAPPGFKRSEMIPLQAALAELERCVEERPDRRIPPWDYRSSLILNIVELEL